MTKAATAERHEIEGPAPIVMMALNSLHLAIEAPKGITLTVRDSSSGSPLTDAELKASIYTNGLIQPLIFKKHEGKNYVIAGNRRLKALREIFAGAEDSMLAQRIQVQDVADFEGDWREIAMDTNLSLPPHLVERYELIVALAKDMKQSPEETCKRYGMSDQQYRRVMALGKMSATVREAWRSGEIDAKTAQAFTLEPVAKEQDRIFDLCKKQGHNGRVEAHHVRNRIIPENQRDAGRLVAFLGLEVCKKAKIVKQEDLFSTGHIVTDLKAVKKMATAKLTERCEQLVADGGWSWAVLEDDIEQLYTYGTLQPVNKVQAMADEASRLDELKVAIQRVNSGEAPEAGVDDMYEEQEKIEEAIKARGFSAAQKLKSGCFLKITLDGSLSIQYGKVKPEARKSVESSDRRASSPATKAREKAKKTGEVVLTNALVERLSEQLQKAGAEALKREHAVATSAVIAAIASGGHILDIHVGGLGAKKSSSFSDVFKEALKSTPQQREAMFGQIAAQALSIQVYNAVGEMPLDDDGTADLFEAMNGARVVSAITDAFDEDDYFGSVALDAIISAVRCSMGDEHADKVAKMKKPDAAKFAAANVPSTKWLPKQLRTAWYTGPEEDTKTAAKPKAPPAKKKTAKKAAKKKSKK